MASGSIVGDVVYKRVNRAISCSYNTSISYEEPHMVTPLLTQLSFIFDLSPLYGTYGEIKRSEDGFLYEYDE